MKTTIISKEEALKLIAEAGQKAVLPYRGYATALNDTDRIGVSPTGEIMLVRGDIGQGKRASTSNW